MEGTKYLKTLKDEYDKEYRRLVQLIEADGPRLEIERQMDIVSTLKGRIDIFDAALVSATPKQLLFD